MNKGIGMRFFYSVCVFMFIAVVAPFHSVSGNNFISKQKQYVKELFNGGRYFDTVAETYRLMNYDKNVNNYSDYRFLIGTAYYLGKQYKKAAVVLSGDEFAKLKLKEKYLLSQSFFKTGDYKTGFSILGSVSYGSINSRDRYRFFFLKVNLLLKEKDIKLVNTEVDKAWEYISDKSSLMQLKNDLADYKELRFKSIPLSVAMSSILPGSGQVYSGRIWDGILSFISVAATATGAYFSYRGGNKGLSYGLIFFSAVFYSGNIYGAYNSADSYNERIYDKFQKSIRDRYVPMYHPMNDFGGVEIQRW